MVLFNNASSDLSVLGATFKSPKTIGSLPSPAVELASATAGEGKLPIVLGDLNVAPKTDKSLDALLKSTILKDPFPAETWTHYYVSQKKVSRLDYILPHKSLKVVSTDI